MSGTMSLEYAEEGKVLPPHTEERTLLFYAKTAFLITKSDVKTTILPATTFAVAAVYSGTEPPPDFPSVLLRLAKSVLWIWMNLWIFNLSNQRLPNSILEDSINKPWRAIPSGRLTSDEARRILLVSIPAVFLASWYLGGSRESLILMVLTWIYNDLGAAEENFLVRHVNNALGFTSFDAGAARVACGPLDNTTYCWLAVIAAAITCTIQFQDMEDQEGDRMRLRRTLPIILGDLPTRRINALTIIIFSILAPAFWQLPRAGYLVPIILGFAIAIRTLTLRSLGADKSTFKMWCLWLVLLYFLPFAREEANVRGWPWFG